MDQNIPNWRCCWKPYPDCPLFNLGNYLPQVTRTYPSFSSDSLHSRVCPCILYVSMTRVKSANHLKIIDFNQHQILPPVGECINVNENHKKLSECIFITVGFSFQVAVTTFLYFTFSSLTANNIAWPQLPHHFTSQFYCDFRWWHYVFLFNLHMVKKVLSESEGPFLNFIVS